MVGLSNIAFSAFMLICLGIQVISDVSDHRYSEGDNIPIYATKVGPYSNPRETYAYYNFPFCSPDVVKEKKVNLGEMLNGDRPVSTPYKLDFLVDKEFAVLCKKTLKKSDVSQFRSMIGNDYYTHWSYDDLPISTAIGRVEKNNTNETIKSKYFLFTHFDFELYYNKDRVVKALLQVYYFSFADVTEDKEIDVELSYTVKWLETNSSFDERMEKLRGSSISHQMQSFSIVNSSFTILYLVIFLAVFYIRVIRKEIAKVLILLTQKKYACDVEEAELADNQEHTGWKNIHGDVFRFPKHKFLFAAALGSGTQLLVFMVAILVLGVLGVFQSYLQGLFWNSLIIIYAVTSVVSGYKSASFYHQLEGTSFIKNILLTEGLYLGPLFATFGFNNTIAILYGSTTALPLSAIVMFSLLLLSLALGLLFLGAVVGKKNNHLSDFQTPCRTTKCPRVVPRLRWYRGILPQMVLAGFLPFGAINIVFSKVLYTLWDHGIYVSYNYMSIMFFLLLITTALVSILMTYFQLKAEDHEWWWRSFLCGGSTGLYMYGYSIYYYFCKSYMNGFIQTSFFFGYMACLSYGIFLVLGTVGFHVSLLFVRYLYSSIKCD